MTTYKLTGSVLSMATGKQTIDTTVETDMDLTGKMSINQLVTLGILPEGTTDDMAMADVTVTKMLTVEVVDWAAAKKLSDVIDYIKVNHPELVTVSSVARTGGGSTLTIAERAEAGYYSKYNLVKNSKTGENDAIQFLPTGKYDVTADLVRDWIATGKVTKPALVAKLQEIYGV